MSKTLIVPKAVWNSGVTVTVAADESQNHGGTPKYLGHGADVEAGQARAAGQVIEHGYSRLLYDAVWGQLNLNGLKRAEIPQGYP